MARILKRPMFRRGGMPSSEGVAAIRPKYMGGGMSGIMTGINPTAGLTPRVGYANGPKPGSTLGRGFSITGSTGSSPIGTSRVFYPPVTTTPAGVPATISSTSGGQVVKEAGEILVIITCLINFIIN